MTTITTTEYLIFVANDTFGAPKVVSLNEALEIAVTEGNGAWRRDTAGLREAYVRMKPGDRLWYKNVLLVALSRSVSYIP